MVKDWAKAFEKPIHTAGAVGSEAWILHERKKRAEAWDRWAELTGQFCSPDEFAHEDKKRCQTRLASDRIAARMERLRMFSRKVTTIRNGKLVRERVGGGGYAGGMGYSYVGLHSQIVDTVPDYRRCNANPYIAQQKRSHLLKALIAYVEKWSVKKGYAFRHVCIHDGPRCGVYALRGRWREQNRRIRTANKSDLFKRLGISFIFRSNEAGSPVKKSHEKTKDGKGRMVRTYERTRKGNRIRTLDAKGRQTWHPHTHAILQLSRFLSDSEFAEMIAYLQMHFNAVEPDQGILREPREACKYLVKVDELNEIDDLALYRFLSQTRGRHLVQALGPLKAQNRKDRDERMVYRFRKDDETGAAKMVRDVNWNSTPEAAAGLTLTEGEKLLKRAHRLQPDPRFDDLPILAKIAPIPRFMPIAEPVLLVRGKVLDVEAFFERSDVKRLMAATEDSWMVGMSGFLAVHGEGKGMSWWERQHAHRIAFQNASQDVQTPVQQSLFNRRGNRGSPDNTPIIGRQAAADPPKPPPGELFEVHTGPKAITSTHYDYEL
jgi:hypothetical protein